MQLEQDYLRLFNASFKSKETAQVYTYHLKRYCNQDLTALLHNQQKEAEDNLISFIIDSKEKGLGWGSLHTFVAAVCRFYLIVRDMELNKNRINRFMPEHLKLKKDRAYTFEEIQKLLELADERSRVIILLLVSSGIRIGALPLLKVSDLLDKVGNNIYKITVYVNTPGEYITFCTPECRAAIESYFEIRQRHGETITGKSPLIREQYNRINTLFCKYPKNTSRAALQFILYQIMEKAGLRTRVAKAPYKDSMKDIQLARGFRKFFNTQLVNSDVNLLHKEMLMGHDINLDASYLRPTEKELEQSYLKAIDYLTINPENRLKRKVEKLEVEKNQFERLAAKIASLEQKINK